MTVVKVIATASPRIVRIVAAGPQGIQGEQGEQGLPGGDYTLPTASDTVLGGVKVGDGLEIDGSGVLSATGGGGGGETNLSYSASTTAGTVANDNGDGFTIAAASGTIAGLMTSTQFTKLDGIAAGATVGATWGTNLYSIPAVVAAMTSQTAAAEAIGKAAIAAELLSEVSGLPKVGGLTMESLPPVLGNYNILGWSVADQRVVWFGGPNLAPLIGSSALADELYAGSFIGGVAMEEQPPSGTGFIFPVYNQTDGFFTWYDSTAINSLIGAQPAIVSVSITGTATTAVVANRFYYHTGASAYTHTLTTGSLSTGDVITIQIGIAASALITISCAAGFGGATSRVMRNGEAMRLYWNGTTFDIVTQVRIPFVGTMAPSVNTSLTAGTETKIPHSVIIGANPGYSMINTSTGRFTAPRAGTYIVQPIGRATGGGGSGLAANAARVITFCRKNAVSGQYFAQHETSALSGGYPFVGIPAPIVLSAGDFLEQYMLIIGTSATAPGTGTTENIWMSMTELIQS